MGMLITEKAVSPTTGAVTWLIVDSATLGAHSEAKAFALFLRGGGKSPNTQRAYVPRVALFLNWCAAQAIDWRQVSLSQLSRFKFHVEARVTKCGTPITGKTVNAVLTAVCEFLRFCASQGFIDRNIASQVSEPRFLKFRPPGFDPGEMGQHLVVRARVLKAPEIEHAPATVTDTEAAMLLDIAGSCRNRFLICLLLDTGLRIGEALGLRREDMHLLPDSTGLGCRVAGAHLHVRPRGDNTNGARAKAGRQRTVPVSDRCIAAYQDYQTERGRLPLATRCDYVFVNLSGATAGGPMRYSNARQIVERLASNTGVVARPHMFRHTAATKWIRSGVRPDVVQALLGHASFASTAVYLHANDDELRAAIEKVEAPK